MNVNERCKYPNGCPIEKYALPIALKEAQRRVAYSDAVLYTDDLDEVIALVDRGNQLGKEIQALSEEKNRFQPCSACPY